jgi:hypothetical protein
MVIIKLFSCDLQIILLFYIYSSTKSILLTGNITRAVLAKLQCLHNPSFIIQCRHYVNVMIQASLWFKRTINHLWNSSVTKRDKWWLIPIEHTILYFFLIEIYFCYWIHRHVITCFNLICPWFVTISNRHMKTSPW